MGFYKRKSALNSVIMGALEIWGNYKPLSMHCHSLRNKVSAFADCVLNGGRPSISSQFALV